MLLSGVTWLRRASDRRRSLVPSLIVGLGLWIGFPTVTAYQDMVSLVSHQETGARWTAVIQSAVAGSVHEAEMPFASGDGQLEGLSGSGLTAPGIGTVAFRVGGKKADGFTDEDAINRTGKKGRLVKVLPMAPPRLFNAGTILQQTGALLEPAPLGEGLVAFAQPEISGKEIQIASAFHFRHEQRGPELPAAIAELVNNEEADILATAYAPSQPDYAKTSPFATILRDENEGRFIPPVPPTDHAWARQPLPPEVFSEREQQCLAAGIYFEARGEPVRGQAAVAQVILNRVRNPAYPDTICGVVYQNKNWRNRCQFSFACDGIKDRVASPTHFRLAQEVGLAVTAGKIWLEEVGTSTHYHATYVRPRWARAMERMNKIGHHIFYRTYGGGWD